MVTDFFVCRRRRHRRAGRYRTLFDWLVTGGILASARHIGACPKHVIKRGKTPCSPPTRPAGNETFSIDIRAEAERVRLSYAVRADDGGREDVVDTVSLIRLPCRFGGNRAYFICPGPGGGTDCGRRITKLHLARRYFLCRHCNQLTYASQYEQPWKRAFRRANNLKQRLAVDVGLDDPFTEKPKGMWTRTYRVLLDKILQAEMLANETQANMFQRLLAQIDNDHG
jgi:hypothetical protein